MTVKDQNSIFIFLKAKNFADPHLILGLFGNGTIRIRFEPIHPSRYIVNCQREEIIDSNGMIKTPINHEYDGKHPWLGFTFKLFRQ